MPNRRQGAVLGIRRNEEESMSEAPHTSEECLKLERKAEYKSEFLGGRIYAMSGASSGHNRISFNIAGLLPTFPA
jgi:Uma2 family endonuclease